MKILQVIPYFCFGGAETMCENLTYALLSLGHDVTVVSLYQERTPISQRMEEAGVKQMAEVYLEQMQTKFEEIQEFYKVIVQLRKFELE